MIDGQTDRAEQIQGGEAEIGRRIKSENWSERGWSLRSRASAVECTQDSSAQPDAAAQSFHTPT